MNFTVERRSIPIVSIITFSVVFMMLTIICTVVWEHTAANLYDCTDPGLFGYLSPGDWVHHFGQRPILVVRRIIHDRSMNEPDTIKEGWNVTRLWCLWLSFVGASILISLAFAGAPWLLFRHWRKQLRSSPAA